MPGIYDTQHTTSRSPASPINTQWINILYAIVFLIGEKKTSSATVILLAKVFNICNLRYTVVDKIVNTMCMRENVSVSQSVSQSVKKADLEDGSLLKIEIRLKCGTGHVKSIK